MAPSRSWHRRSARLASAMMLTAGSPAFGPVLTASDSTAAMSTATALSTTAWQNGGFAVDTPQRRPAGGHRARSGQHRYDPVRAVGQRHPGCRGVGRERAHRAAEPRRHLPRPRVARPGHDPQLVEADRRASDFAGYFNPRADRPEDLPWERWLAAGISEQHNPTPAWYRAAPLEEPIAARHRDWRRAQQLALYRGSVHFPLTLTRAVNPGVPAGRKLSHIVDLRSLLYLVGSAVETHAGWRLKIPDGANPAPGADSSEASRSAAGGELFDPNRAAVSGVALVVLQATPVEGPPQQFEPGQRQGFVKPPARRWRQPLTSRRWPDPAVGASRSHSRNQCALVRRECVPDAGKAVR